MCPLVPTLNCVKLEDYLLVPVTNNNEHFPVTIHTICMVLFMPTKTVGTHAATCDRVVLVSLERILCPFWAHGGYLTVITKPYKTKIKNHGVT